MNTLFETGLGTTISFGTSLESVAQQHQSNYVFTEECNDSTLVFDASSVPALSGLSFWKAYYAFNNGRLKSASFDTSKAYIMQREYVLSKEMIDIAKSIIRKIESIYGLQVEHGIKTPYNDTHSYKYAKLISDMRKRTGSSLWSKFGYIARHDPLHIDIQISYNDYLRHIQPFSSFGMDFSNLSVRLYDTHLGLRDDLWIVDINGNWVAIYIEEQRIINEPFVKDETTSNIITKPYYHPTIPNCFMPIGIKTIHTSITYTIYSTSELFELIV